MPFTLTLASGPTWTSGNDYVLFTFTPSETLSDAANLTPASSAYGVLQGDFVTDADTAAAQVISNVVTVAVPITLDGLGQRPMFVSGSSVTLGSFSYVANGYRYNFAGATYSLAESATVQSLLIDNQTFTLQNGEFKALIKSTDAQAVGIADGEYSVQSVNPTSLSIETITGDMYVSQNNGDIYISLDGLTALYWGANSNVTIVTAPQIRINGVAYAPNFTAAAATPTATSTQKSVTTAIYSAQIDISYEYAQIYIETPLQLPSGYSFVSAPNTCAITISGIDVSLSTTTDLTYAGSGLYFTQEIEVQVTEGNAYTGTFEIPSNYTVGFTNARAAGFTVDVILAAIQWSGNFDVS